MQQQAGNSNQITTWAGSESNKNWKLQNKTKSLPPVPFPIQQILPKPVDFSRAIVPHLCWLFMMFSQLNFANGKQASNLILRIENWHVHPAKWRVQVCRRHLPECTNPGRNYVLKSISCAEPLRMARELKSNFAFDKSKIWQQILSIWNFTFRYTTPQLCGETMFSVLLVFLCERSCSRQLHNLFPHTPVSAPGQKKWQKKERWWRYLRTFILISESLDTR